MIKLAYTYICDECKAEKTERYNFDIAAISSAPQPLVPWFWKYINGKLYCDEHDVTVKVKKRKGKP